MSTPCCSSPHASLQNLDSIDCLPERSMAVLNIAGLHTFSFPDPSLCNNHHKANVPFTSLSLASLKTPKDNVNVQNNLLESSVFPQSNESCDVHCSSQQIIHSVTESVCKKNNGLQATDSVHITLNPLMSSVTNVSPTSFFYPQIPPNSENCVHYRAIQPMLVTGDLSSIAVRTNHLTLFGELSSVKSERDCNIYSGQNIVSRDVGNACKSVSDSRDVGDYISLIKCELDTIDSHIDNAVITVNERNAPNVRDCHTPLENNIDNYFNEKSVSFTSWSKYATSPSDLVMDGSASDVMDLNDPASPVAARTYNHNGVSGTHSNFVEFPESDSFDNEEGSLLSMPAYQNFFCIICGKSEIICEQNNLDNSLAGSAQVLVIDILVRILNTDESSLYKRSAKICIKCYKVIDEIEYLKEALDKKEKVIKHMFNETSTWIDKIETDECCDKSLNNLFEKTEKNTVQLKVNSYIRNNLDLINAPFVLNNKDDVEEGSDTAVMNKVSRKCKQYRCFRCHADFKTAHERKTHMCQCQIRVLERKSINITENSNDTLKLNDKIAHSKKKSMKTYACEQCSETFNSRNSLLTHAANHQTSFDCHVCGRYLTTKARLLAHLFKFHGIGIGKSKSEQCDHCDKSFQTKAGLSYHKNVTHQVGTKYVCEHCQKVYYYHVPYKSHMLFAHGKKKVVCETCGEMFFTVSKLNTHINAVHRNAKTWQCVKCDVKFTTGTAFRQHNLVQHHNTRHACEYCTAQYRKKSALYAHLREHSIYKCRSCRDIFTDEHLYNVHISAVHNQVPPKMSKKRVSASGTSAHQRKSGIRASIARPRDNKGVKVSTSSLPSHLQPVNLNDLLLTNSYNSNSNNLQVFGTVPSDKLSSVNLSDSTGKIRSFNLLNQEAGLDMESEVNCLTIEDGVPFIDEEILDSIEISASRTELSTDDSHVQERLSSSMVDISNLDNLPPHVTAFEETDPSVVDCLVKQNVDGISTSVTDLNSNVRSHHHHISHTDLGSTIHDLTPSVNELSPPNNNINSSVDLDQVVDIEPSVHNLDSSVKSIDHSTIWAMLKGGSHEENLQSIPSSAIDDLDIGGVIDGTMVDVHSTMVVADGTMDATVVVEDNCLVDADSVLVVGSDVLSNACSPLGLGMSVNITEGDSEDLDVLNVDITC